MLWKKKHLIHRTNISYPYVTRNVILTWKLFFTSNSEVLRGTGLRVYSYIAIKRDTLFHGVNFLLETINSPWKWPVSLWRITDAWIGNYRQTNSLNWADLLGRSGDRAWNFDHAANRVISGISRDRRAQHAAPRRRPDQGVARGAGALNYRIGKRVIRQLNGRYFPRRNW